MTQPDSIFVVSFTRKIWHVTLEGAFFGDYRSKENALKGIEEAREALEASGRGSKVVMGVIEMA